MKTIYNINPSAKMLVIFLYVGILIFNINFGFNLSMLTVSFLFLILTVKNIKSLGSVIVAAILFSSTIFFMNFFFYTNGHIPFTLLFMHGTYEGMRRGIVLSMRASSIIFLSVGYLFSTEPFSMIQSFMQNLRIPEKIGYALLISLREVHLFKKNLISIERAVKFRKGAEKITLSERMRMIIPLFAMVVRKGERSAIALEMRGMILKRKGGYYKDMRYKAGDWIFLLVSTLIVFVFLYVFGVRP